MIFSALKNSLYCFCLLFLTSCSASPFPTLDADANQKTRQFRTAQTFFQGEEKLKEGLENLSISGSGQFYKESFDELIKLTNDPSKIIVIDLRQESHGYINGLPVSWTDGAYNQANRHKTLEEIEADELNRIQNVYKEGMITLYSKFNEPIMKPFKVNEAMTEKEAVEELKMQYIRMPVSDFYRPSDSIVDEFVALILSLPKDNWLHFHCKAGNGRTTTFMCLYDMMFNAQTKTFDQILTRQKLLGGKDLRRNEKDPIKAPASKERLLLLENFYQYCLAVPDFTISWSSWIQEQESCKVTSN